jgi:hypothetical protein
MLVRVPACGNARRVEVQRNSTPVYDAPRGVTMATADLAARLHELGAEQGIPGLESTALDAIAARGYETCSGPVLDGWQGRRG